MQNFMMMTTGSVFHLLHSRGFITLQLMLNSGVVSIKFRVNKKSIN